MEDEKIIELYFERNQSAIDETDKKYGKLIKNISRNILNSLPDVEECVSDTYMQLWNSIPPKEPPSLKTYACKIVRNLSINRLEFLCADKRGAGKSCEIIDELAEAIPSKENVEEKIELTALTEAINSFLSSISTEQRIIFVKRYWFLKSDEEISSELGVSLAKVRTSLSRTRKKLKVYLIKEGYTL
ncbi:MAG: sigma-70 family RNA polymerase sigma factor [Oscillospiraceae bacterium]|nr:sigma-70 family RNA polymerase sigma factor [Oscillospiraceae bacterium]